MNIIPQLEKLHIYLTNKCNNQCLHCWVNAKPNKKSCLNYNDITKQIDKAIPLGLKIIKITGGEPLLFQKTLEDILFYSFDKKLEIRLETNASLITNEFVKKLSDFNINVYASLDGSTSVTHDYFRDKNGSFRQTIKGIKKLVTHKINTEIICCLYKNNINELNDIIQLVIQLGVQKLKFNFPSPYGRGEKLEKNMSLLSIKEILNVTSNIEKYYYKKNNLTIDIDIPRALLKYPKNGKRCDVFNIISILPNGYVSLCGIGVTIRDFIFGHIEDNIDEIWKNNELLHKMRKQLSSGGQKICQLCTEYNNCYAHCIAYSLTKYKSLNGPHPLCQNAFIEGLFPKKFIRQDKLIMSNLSKEISC